MTKKRSHTKADYMRRRAEALKIKPPVPVRKGGAGSKGARFNFEPDLDNQYPGQVDSDGDRQPRKKKK